MTFVHSEHTLVSQLDGGSKSVGSLGFRVLSTSGFPALPFVSEIPIVSARGSGFRVLEWVGAGQGNGEVFSGRAVHQRALPEGRASAQSVEKAPKEGTHPLLLKPG